MTCFGQDYTLEDFELFEKFERLIYELPEYKDLDKNLRAHEVSGLYQNTDYYSIDTFRSKKLHRSDIVRCQIGVLHGMNADTDKEMIYNIYYSISKDSIIRVEDLRQ